MDLIEELRKGETVEKPPGKVAVSAYLTERQHERLLSLAGKADKSVSKTIGRMVDLFFEQTRDGGGAA